jgi:hypothetical protein
MGSRGAQANISLFVFQTNPNRMQDVLVDRGQRLSQQPLCDGNLQTCELHIVLHLLAVDRWEQTVGRDR